MAVFYQKDKMKLYDINTEIHTVQMMMEEWAIEHDGDITDFPLNENLAGIEMERETKLLSIACVIKDYEGDAEKLEAEIKRQTKRKKSAESKAESMRIWLERNLEPGEKLEDHRAGIGWRKSTALEMTCQPESLPDYLQKVTIKADMNNIKDCLKRGELVPGCALVTKQNLQIR
jgi:Siphovirus Gp157